MKKVINSRLKERKIIETMMICLLPIILYGIIGPLEIYVGNMHEFEFLLKDFFYQFLAISIALWLFCCVILILLPPRISDFIRVLIFAFSILSYLQNMFLNIKLMNKNGDMMDWESMRGIMITNLIIWIVIAIVCFVIPIILKKKYLKIYSGISTFLSAVQLVTIITLVIQVNSISYSNNPVALDLSDQFCLAENNNIIVLVFDSFDNIDFENAMAENVEFSEVMKDFTYYNNADSHYFYTFPSMLHILTGTEYNCDISQSEWINTCWDAQLCQDFYSKLHEMDYECGLYTNVDEMPQQKDGTFDNVVKRERIIRTDLLIRLLEKMTIYKYMPYIFKPRFEVASYVIKESVIWDFNQNFNYVCYWNGNFYEKLSSDGLQIDETLTNKFSISLINGLHRPWKTMSDGRDSLGETSIEETSAGLCVIITEYLEQLKQLGIYDDAVIIITADHGRNLYYPQVTYLIKLPHSTQMEMSVTNAPITHDDFQATILDILGENYDAYGTSIFDWSDNEIRKREVWIPTENMWGGGYGGFVIYSYEGDRYDLINQKEEDAVLVTYPLN